eukprot:scaffold248384_cov67-Cyclotella_meneghiniana.AAC.5
MALMARADKSHCWFDVTVRGGDGFGDEADSYDSAQSPSKVRSLHGPLKVRPKSAQSPSNLSGL